MSEPQQHGWQPPDLPEPQEKAEEKSQSQRGFGLFEAPSVPDEFPVFTPYSSPYSSTSSAGSAPEATPHGDEFPPDSAPLPERSATAFPGFPSDDAPAAPSGYVPAPAVMPIPGVSHDAFAPEPPAPVPPAVPEIPEVPSAAGSWSAFAAAESPKQPTPPPWAAPYTLDSSGESGGYEPTSYGDSYQPVSPAAPTPSESSRPAEPAVAFPATVYPPEPPPFEPPAFLSSQEPPAFIAPAEPPAFVAPADPPFAASFAAAEPEPADNETPPPAGPVRAAASVPHRVAPPVEPPPAMPRPVGRVYGSAAASVAPADEPVSPAAVSPAHPVSLAQPVSPASPGGFEPAPVVAAATGTAEPTGSIRASARPIHLSQPDPTDAVPTGRSSTIYASPSSSATVTPAVTPVAPPHAVATGMPPRQNRQHAYGDLLEPTSPAIPGQRPPQSPQPAMPAPSIPPQRAGQPPTAPQDSRQPGPDQFATRPAEMPLDARPSLDGRPSMDAKPTSEPKPVRKGRLIIGVLAGCAALLAVAFGALLLLDKLVAGPTFNVGDCVKQNGGEAVAADCAESGAFKVVAAVSSQEECDQTQPFVQQGGNQILCLRPADDSAGTPGVTPTPTPSS